MMYAILLLHSTCLVIITTGLQCSRGGYKGIQPQFGPECMYRCHCIGDVQCDNDTGTCKGGCAAGWMGPGCQYSDIAYNKTAWQVSQRFSYAGAEKAVDGNMSSCSETNQTFDQWWKVDLNAVYRITGLEIHSSETGLKYIEVRVGNVSSNSSADFPRICFNHSVNENISEVTYVLCTSELIGNQVMILMPGLQTTMKLCDVRVYGGRSLAYRRVASQTSVDDGGEASLAVDGGTNTRYHDKSCSQTSDVQSPWWRVDLVQVYNILRITVINRGDCCAERLSGFSVSFATNNTYSLVFKYPDETPKVETEITTLSQDLAQKIEISLKHRTGNSSLTLCEVFVFGECQDNLCGWTCDTSCYCKGPIEKQNKIGAICPDGCNTGWWGYSCNFTCDTNCKGNICNQRDGHCFECFLGKWGHFCKNDCTNCTNGTGCGNSDGTCTVGCLTGLYGANCNQRCGHCADDGSCNRYTGACSHGCQPGWQEENCTKACSRDWYGFNCNNMCGHCANITCDHINGTCPLGCSEGYNGTRCFEHLKEEKEDKLSAFPIFIPVGVAVGAAGLIIIILVALIIWRRRIGTHQRTRYQSEVPDRNTSSAKMSLDIYENIATLKLGEERSTMPPTYENSFCNVNCGTKGDIVVKKADESVDTIDTHIYTNAGVDIESMGESDTDETVENRDDSAKRGVYYNSARRSRRVGKKIAVQDISDYIKRGIHLSNDIEKQFKELLSGPQHDMNIALKPINRQKNRYKGMYAYDKNRVILEPLSDDPDTDYINASFINGYKRDEAYIAAQGTITATINDFWRMIWQYDIQQIVMLTGLIEQGKQKCLQYWPNRGTNEYGMILVECTGEDVCAEYTIRSFQILKTGSNKQKKITQFHFTSWPDRGVPDTATSLVQFWKEVRHSGSALDSPILVHCSAGIGRTGTYIALDCMFDEGSEEGYVNIFECINKLREQRVGLVQTTEQYVYLHEVLLEAFQDTGKAVSVDDFQNHYEQIRHIDPETKKTKLLTEFEKLQEDENTYFERDRMRLKKDKSNDPKDEFLDGKLPENKPKNRCNNILPSERYRPYLSTYVPGRNDYINAICLPTRKNLKGLLVTQMPLPDTVIDFWRLVYDYEVQSIVMLNEANMPGEVVGVYWPETDETSRYGPFEVTITSNAERSSHVERLLKVSKRGEGWTLSLKQFVCNVWSLQDAVPQSMDGFLNLIDDVEDWKKQSGERPILVHCMNGAERSGLFCVLWCALEKLTFDREVAIQSIVRQMRVRRQHIIPNFEQYQFCHDVISFSLNKSITYTNI